MANKFKIKSSNLIPLEAKVSQLSETLILKAEAKIRDKALVVLLTKYTTKFCKDLNFG